MKKLVSVVVIIAVLVLGGYYVMGMVTERTLKKNIAMLDQSNELLLSIEQYDRNWFNSKAVLRWQLHVPQRVVKNKEGQPITIAAQNFDVKMPLTILHGPIIFSDKGVLFGLGAANSRMDLPKDFSDKFAEIYTNTSIKPQVDLQVYVNYLNKTNLHIEIPAFNLIAKAGGQQFQWQGMMNDIHLSSNYHHVNGNLALAGVRLTKDQYNLAVNHVNSDYDLHQTDIGLFLGRADLDVASVEITNQQEKLFNLEQFSAHSSTDVLDGLFQSDVKVSLNKLFAHDKTYGPGMLTMSIKNIDAKVLAEVNDQVNQIQQGTDIEKQRGLLMLFSELPKLVSHGAELNISELTFGLPEGMLRMTLMLALPNEPVNNPMDIVQKIKGQAKIEVPSVVVQALMEETAKQKLMKQSVLQQAMVQQMQANAKIDASTNGVDAAKANAQMPMEPAVVAPGDILQQAKTLASEKIASLVKAGALVVLEGNYVVELQLEKGQLSVNGKPFNSAMVPFL